MKKSLIVTLYGEFNFGNRLQNYALQTLLGDLGYSVENLVVVKQDQFVLTKTVKLYVKTLLTACGIGKYRKSFAQELRTHKFLSFRRKYFSNIVFYARDKVDVQDWSRYDYAIAGSDQVWHNWGKFENELDFYYLSFIEPSKRISYAPSFGFTRFPQEDIDAHRRGLSGMRFLSCREQEGCELIRNLTGIDAQRVLDPTLMLTKEQWIEVENKPLFSVPNGYLLTFFLGDITEEYRQEIEHIKDEKNLKEININDPNDPKHYAVSPDEFVWLIHHADVICTDSFHCSVFSIVFNRGLRVFERVGQYEDMFGRLRDLLALFELSELAFKHDNDERLSTTLSKDAMERYKKERNNSLGFLKDALGVKAEPPNEDRT